MALFDILENLGEQRTEADRRIATALMSDLRETVFLSTNAVAKRGRVDPATVVRFARKLGYDGYPALRTRLQRELLGASEAADRMRSRMRRLGKTSLLRSFIEIEIEHLNALAEQLADAHIADAARLVVKGGQTHVFAVGHAGALALLLRSRLGRVGRRTQILSTVARDAAVDLLNARAGDTFILFALNAVHPLIPKVLEHARRIDCASIVITDMMRLAMRPKPDILLAGFRGTEGEPRSLIVPMMICNALVLHVSRVAKRKALGSLERLDDIRRRLEPVA